MKKFVVLLVVVAMTCFSAMAFAADVTVGGSYEIRSKNFSNLGTAPEAVGSDRSTDTRIRIDVNAKAGDVKGKLQLNNDFGHTWGEDDQTGTFETIDGPAGAKMGFREAWINFNLPGLPVNVTAGHQLLTLGNGWFFRSMHYGSDAWVVANQSGPNTLALVNIKVDEGLTANSDDIDAYTILDVFKLDDNMSIGVDFTNINDRKGALVDATIVSLGGPAGAAAGQQAILRNLGVSFNGKFGPLALKAEADFQMGDIDASNLEFGGNQIVIQGVVGLDPVKVNFTLARGSGDDNDDDTIDMYVPVLDVDPHYTFLHEYKVKGASGRAHDGFANTTALGVGASFSPAASLAVAADFWLLQATEDVSLNNGAPDSDLGMEVDVKLNWKLADNLAWNWTVGYFKPGDAYNNAAGQDSDNVTGVQGVLAFKF